MKNTNGQATETLKKSVTDASQKSKEVIKSIIDTNSKQFTSAIESNTKAFDSLSKMLYDKEMDPHMVSLFKTQFGKGLKLSEDTIDSIIDIHKKRVDLSIDFVNKITELMKMEDLHTKKGMDKLINLMKEYFEQSTNLSVESTKNTVSMYNNHLNLALNFNTKCAESINSHIASAFQIQRKNFDTYFGIDALTKWWKDAAEDKVEA